jgi:hypothetical protein
VQGFLRGFRELAFAAILIGFARAIFVVLQDGRIIGTIVSGVVAPVEKLPVTLSALAMIIAHVVIHFPVSSTSGQAVPTMPVLLHSVPRRSSSRSPSDCGRHDLEPLRERAPQPCRCFHPRFG